MNERAWNELLDEFRALGGTAENIRQGIGPLGRGLFAVDPASPVVVRVPENLLVRAEHVIFVDGSPQIDPDARFSERERVWLNTYLEKFSWGGGGRAEVEHKLAIAQELPAELHDRLRGEFRCGAWLDDVSDEIIQQRFLRTREITYNNRNVIPPILEFANHGKAPGFDGSHGLSIEGMFSDEVLVQYEDIDAFGIFKAWGFSFASPVALSIALQGSIQSVPLSIARQRSQVDQSVGGWVPTITSENGQQKMSFLLLGHEQYPRLARGIFYHLMQKAGYGGAKQCFDQILDANRAHFLRLRSALQGRDYPIAQTLRAMADHQLRAMTFAQEFP